VVGVSSPSARRDFHRPHPGGRKPFSIWSKPLLDGWEIRAFVTKYARTCRNGRGTLQDHLRRRGGGHLEKLNRRTFSLVSLEQSRKAAVTTADHLPLRVHDHPVHTALVLQHPHGRTAYVATSAYATPRVHHHSSGIVDTTITTTRMISENPNIARTARGRVESAAYTTILEVTGPNPVSTK
jgi:hypothetical protein